jgi:hypothetical protein
MYIANCLKSTFRKANIVKPGIYGLIREDIIIYNKYTLCQSREYNMWSILIIPENIEYSVY